MILAFPAREVYRYPNRDELAFVVVVLFGSFALLGWPKEEPITSCALLDSSNGIKTGPSLVPILSLRG